MEELGHERLFPHTPKGDPFIVHDGAHDNQRDEMGQGWGLDLPHEIKLAVIDGLKHGC